MKISLLICIFSLFFLPFAFASEAWQPINVGINELMLRCIAIDPSNPNTIYVGTEKGIYKSVNGGRYFRSSLVLSSNEKVNFLAINPTNSKIVLAATQNGLLETKNNGKNWQKIFRGTAELERNMLSLAVNPAKPKLIYLGTTRGLFKSNNAGRSWRKASGLLSHYPVLFILIEPEGKNIYASTTEGVFKSSDERENWQKIHASQDRESENNNYDADTDKEIWVNTEQAVKCITISDDKNKIFLSDSSGVLESQDSGVTWHRLTQTGLLNSKVNFLTFFSKDLYAATQNGIFKFLTDKNIWQAVYRGLTAKQILFLASQDKVLFAATDKGLFKMDLGMEVKSTNLNLVQQNKASNFPNEPSILEVHKAAIEYAEVDPNKIRGWRMAARNRAWFPKLSVGFDRDEDISLHVDTGGTTQADFYITGPTDVSKGWDISLDWDLGDLIWNSSQTSIDSRSKLMVELRQDVLDQVTKFYFERQRLKKQILLTPPPDQMTKLEQEIRLEELTASIDALTGGYFSEEIKGRSNEDAIYRTK